MWVFLVDERCDGNGNERGQLLVQIGLDTVAHLASVSRRLISGQGRSTNGLRIAAARKVRRAKAARNIGALLMAVGFRADTQRASDSERVPRTTMPGSRLDEQAPRISIEGLPGLDLYPSGTNARHLASIYGADQVKFMKSANPGSR